MYTFQELVTMFNAFKNLKDSLSIIFTAALVLFLLIAVNTCSHYQNAVDDFEAAAKLQIQENQKLKLQYQAEAIQTELDWKVKEQKAYEKYTQDIQAIHSQYADNLQLANRVQYHTTETIKYMPTITRETLEAYATAQSNGVSECTALLTEADRIAREYDAEIERIIKSYPTAVDPQPDIRMN